MRLRTYSPISRRSLQRALFFVPPASSRHRLRFRVRSGSDHRSPATGPLTPMRFPPNMLPRREPFLNAPRSPLCFHNLTNCFPRKCFGLIFIQIAGGCHPLDAARERNFLCRAKLNLFCFIPFRTLLRFAKIQLFCFHSLAHSFRKTTGVGGSLVIFLHPTGHLAKCSPGLQTRGFCPSTPKDNLGNGVHSRKVLTLHTEMADDAHTMQPPVVPGRLTSRIAGPKATKSTLRRHV